MLEPARVAECVAAMRARVRVPVTVKTRLGVDEHDSYEFLHAFARRVVDVGCRTLIVHARKAWLDGLSPKQNREVPPLDYARVYRLKGDYPDVEIVINGGLTDAASVRAQFAHVDGVMLGRAAYHDPGLLAAADARLFGGEPPPPAEVVRRMHRYAVEQVARGTPLRAILRHMLGLYQGQPGARAWRRMLSAAPGLAQNDPALLLEALDRLEGTAALSAAAA
jgi:tRNA-dihydrouridine synthase A